MWIGSSGIEVMPITYSDNYVTLFPGESTTLTARYARSGLGGQAPLLRLRGYNVPGVTGPVVGVQEGVGQPLFRLGEIRPNPFTHRTTVRFDLSQRERVRVWVYDVNGRLVRKLINGILMEPGSHDAEWDGNSDAGTLLASGLYLCRLDVGGRSETRRIALLR